MKKNNEMAKAFGKKARLLAHHLRPAAFALILGVSAALAAALLRTLFTQVVRFAVDGVLLGDLTGLPEAMKGLSPAALLGAACAAAAVIAIAEFGVGYVQDASLP